MREICHSSAPNPPGLCSFPPRVQGTADHFPGYSALHDPSTSLPTARPIALGRSHHPPLCARDTPSQRRPSHLLSFLLYKAVPPRDKCGSFSLLLGDPLEMSPHRTWHLPRHAQDCPSPYPVLFPSLALGHLAERIAICSFTQCCVHPEATPCPTRQTVPAQLGLQANNHVCDFLGCRTQRMWLLPPRKGPKARGSGWGRLSVASSHVTSENKAGTSVGHLGVANERP